MVLGMGACSEDETKKDDDVPGGGQEPTEVVHYDIWVGLEQNAMGRFGTLLVKNVNSLEKNRLGSGESSFGVGNRRERLGLNPGKHKDTIIFDSSGGTTG